MADRLGRAGGTKGVGRVTSSLFAMGDTDLGDVQGGEIRSGGADGETPLTNREGGAE